MANAIGFKKLNNDRSVRPISGAENRNSTVGIRCYLVLSTLQLKHAPIRKLKRRVRRPILCDPPGGTSGIRIRTARSMWRIHNVFHTSLLRPFKIVPDGLPLFGRSSRRRDRA